MRKILVVTVGGSCTPIVKSIIENKPDKVYFLCSDDDRLSSNKGSYTTVIGQGKVCGTDWKNPDLPNIVTQAKLAEESYEYIKIKYFDDHNHCYKISLELLRKLKNSYPEAELIADYTGGTKSMTVGLVMAAADLGEVTIGIVKGERSNLIKVDDGSERINLSRINYAFLEKQKMNVYFFIKEFDYSSARMLLENMFRTYSDLPKDLEDELSYVFSLSKAFEAWDKFQHEKAKRLLEPIKKNIVPQFLFLEAIIKSLAFVENQSDLDRKVNGFEVVEDLLLNAQRRAHNERFDDAVARIYRALELFAQIYLKKYFSINTGNVDLDKLPEKLREEYKNKVDGSGKIRLGLMESYTLLENFETDEIGLFFKQNRKKLLSNLEVRNASILAHGFTPVTKEKFDEVYQKLATNFLFVCLQKVRTNSNLSNQLPNDI